MYNEQSLEEDRRLFYVAISRAKNRLIIYDRFDGDRTLDDIVKDFDFYQYSDRMNFVEKPKTIDTLKALLKKK
jgi:superfamily I DNA/RNA helicase